MYMFLPFLTAFIGLVLVWFQKRVAGLLMLAVTVLTLMVWFRFHATSHLNISLWFIVSKQSFPSLAALGNQLSLLAVFGTLSYAFFDQLYFGELPCPLCLMQRIGFVIIGFALVLNIRCGAHSAHYGWGIIGGLVGMMVSLRQVLIHILPGDKGFGSTFLELHFYTWAFVGYLGLLAGFAILLMLPNREVRSRSWFANALVIAFILLVFGNLVSTLLECGIGPCADDPVRYDGLLWLRSRLGI